MPISVVYPREFLDGDGKPVDIVPDFKSRHGIATSSDVGQVPDFWGDLKGRYPDALELTEDPEQDGFGIGVLRQVGAP